MNLKWGQWVWKGLKNALKTVNLACHYHEIQWDSTSHFPMTLLQVQTTWNTSPQKKETETNCEHIHMYLVFKLPYFVSEITHHIWQIVSICEISKCWRFIDYFCDFTSYENMKRPVFDSLKVKFSFESKTSRGKRCQWAKYSFTKIMTPKRKRHFMKIFIIDEWPFIWIHIQLESFWVN